MAQAQGRNGISQEKAVWKALDRLGDQTSIARLQQDAELFYGYTMTSQAVGAARSAWRKKNKIARDNRTYEGQPRRNMLNDNRIELAQVKRLRAFIAKGGNLVALAALIGDGLGCFHSIDQLRNSLQELEELQIAA